MLSHKTSWRLRVTCLLLPSMRAGGHSSPLGKLGVSLPVSYEHGIGHDPQEDCLPQPFSLNIDSGS